MPFELFEDVCPEIGKAERRLLEIREPKWGVPTGRYMLLDYYCTEPDCDCRCVAVKFIPFEADAPPAAAVIMFGWERVRYYRKHSHDPQRWRQMAGATLEPFCDQGPHAHRFLDLFKALIKAGELEPVLRRHYRLLKDKVAVDFAELL